MPQPLLHRPLAVDKPSKRPRVSYVFRIAFISACELPKAVQTCLICHEKSASRESLAWSGVPGEKQTWPF
ncbi:hypothetical protein SAMN05444169_3569 [Bradyrhizobium erythrophlei]|uniref:Uncharacterized protein n=1 Tax=Bradyrhizobium erythrophlei TaxID=1437360 RepID=A0A1M5LP87_9BRAD|nr:hypothetical protein SAMN05444169_3569 [Bradyrhizobium erythrophlei]